MAGDVAVSRIIIDATIAGTLIATAALLSGCAPTLPGVPSDLYSRPGYVYVAPRPLPTPAEERANLAAYYGAAWFADCRGIPSADGAPACQFLKRNGTLPWRLECDFCCLREP